MQIDMHFGVTPYTLTLRRARHLQAVLFGAFVYFYVTTLWGERLHVLMHNDHALPLHLLGAACTLVAVGLYLLISRHHSLFPAVWNTRRLIACLIATFTLCLVTSPREDEELLRLTARLNRLGDYESSLAASEQRQHPTVGILAQRALSLQALDRLSERFFTYPLPATLSPDAIEAVTPDTTLRLLLSRDLDGLARYLVQHLDERPAATFQRAEREALVLYARLRAQPILVIHDTTVEQRYRDFCDARARLSGRPSVALYNLLGETYGDTYWHYYFHDK